MAAGNKQREIGRALMQAETAHDTVLGQALQQPENGGLVALVGETLRCGELGQGHRAVVFQQAW